MQKGKTKNKTDPNFALSLFYRKMTFLKKLIPVLFAKIFILRFAFLSSRPVARNLSPRGAPVLTKGADWITPE